MPPGDAQRAWFPEMLERLKAKWKPELTWKKQIGICEEMTEFREQIAIKGPNDPGARQKTPHGPPLIRGFAAVRMSSTFPGPKPLATIGPRQAHRRGDWNGN